MTPRERADRLFDRIMTAAEQGDSSQMRFFRPMAIQAYGMLGAPNPHIRYDVGMIHAVTGDGAAALAQADSIERAEPTNLLASLIRGTVATMRGDSAALRRTYQTFLDRYDRENALGRDGYVQHATAINAFRDEARKLPAAARRGRV